MTKNLRRVTSGLTRQILQWFLLLSLVPLALISGLSYQTARNQLFESTVRNLEDVTRLQTAFIQAKFSHWLVQLNAESERFSNSQFLETLIQRLADQGKSPPEFIKSYAWAKIIDEKGIDLTNLLNSFNYHDVFLIDQQGNILFSVAKEGDLGENLNQGYLATTRFSATVKQSLFSGKTVFSDLEYYAYSDNKMSAFVAAPLLDAHGEKLGVIAFQLSEDQINQTIGYSLQSEDSVRHYLLGRDLSLRTENALGETFPALKKPVDTTIAQAWLHALSQPGNHDNAPSHIYVGPLGKRVLGVYGDLNIAGVHWVHITEVDEQEAFAAANDLKLLTLILISTTFLLVILIALPVTRRIVKPILTISDALTKVSEGDLKQEIKSTASNELGLLARGFNQMIGSLQASSEANEQEQWLQDGMNAINKAMQGDQDIADLTRNIIGFLCPYLQAQMGAMYVVRNRRIQLMGSYAFSHRKGFQNHFDIGEGMVGQAALEQQTLTLSPVPDDYYAIASGLGETNPKVITICPLLWNNQVIALLEFATYAELNRHYNQLLVRVGTSIAVAVQTALARDNMQVLLTQTQAQAKELQTQEEALRSTNSVLEEQKQYLKLAADAQQKTQVELEEKNSQLQVQQEELRVANEELEEKASALKRSRDNIDAKNHDLEIIQKDLEQKAADLSSANHYKSEFLANMSHELRSPLNSLLILAKLLSENAQGNLTDKQVEFSRTIHESGSDLLNLINDILDLAKIESGKMDLQMEHIHLKNFVSGFQRKYQPLAANKGIEFVVECEHAPEVWRSDAQKLTQVINNLLSNAIKFTHQGCVTLRLSAIPKNCVLTTPGLNADNGFALCVTDTGVGIPEAQQQTIFEAFQQVDGSTNRQYGGTGLGLSISRELATLLGGEIQLYSTRDNGSTFTLYLPLTLSLEAPTKPTFPSKTVQNPRIPPTDPETHSRDIPDDRHTLKQTDRSLLIIEDDELFSTIVMDVARERGFKVLLANNGETGLQFAEQYLPSGIVLDIGLPGIDGWQVLERLKEASSTRHIPVHFMSVNQHNLDAMKHGAIGFLTKPVDMAQMTGAFQRIENIIDRPVKKLLLVEDNLAQQQSLQALIGEGDVHITLANSGAEATAQLKSETFDCIVLDLGLPDMSGTEFLETLRTTEGLQEIPVVVYTGKDISPEERATLDQFAQSIIIKDVRSPERLLDDTTLFLHRIEANMPIERRRMIRMLHDRESVFADRKVLLVDDDLRNIFALSSILQEKSMTVITANNGYEALEKIQQHPDVAIVLMDIMMPDMDGYEATEKIRQIDHFSQTPIIALTAKAMQGDRSKCIAVGASDYLSKPVDSEQLLSMMRVWLYQ